MNYKSLWPGNEAPEQVNVIIEISACSTPVKYEMDKDSSLLHVDRFLNTAMHYPCNYGYVPGTKSPDGDAVDVLVVTPFPLQPACVITVRPVGVLEMSDEKGKDRKILAVPTEGLVDIYDHIKDYNDLPTNLLKKIEHFFVHYKDLDVGKWSKVESWFGLDEAKKEIIDGIKAFQTTETI